MSASCRLPVPPAVYWSLCFSQLDVVCFLRPPFLLHFILSRLQALRSARHDGCPVAVPLLGLWRCITILRGRCHAYYVPEPVPFRGIRCSRR